MTKVKHTPGPWHISSDDPLAVRAEDGDGDDWEVANAVDYCGFPEIQSKANARLIAAAPDLLAALERLAESPMFLAIEGHAEATAAIAKAKGE